MVNDTERLCRTNILVGGIDSVEASASTSSANISEASSHRISVIFSRKGGITPGQSADRVQRAAVQEAEPQLAGDRAGELRVVEGARIAEVLQRSGEPEQCLRLRVAVADRAGQVQRTTMMFDGGRPATTAVLDAGQRVEGVRLDPAIARVVGQRRGSRGELCGPTGVTGVEVH